MFQTRTSLLKVDDVGNAMDESPEKLAKSILLFCKGLGFFTSVDLPGVDRRSSQVRKKLENCIAFHWSLGRLILFGNNYTILYVLGQTAQ